MKVFLIYCLTNKTNNKKYVGKFNRDIKEFNSYYGSGNLIKRAIKKYGKNNFNKEILEECDCLSNLNKQEIYWILKLKTSENGYNLAKGGDGGDTSKFINYKNEKYLEIKRNDAKKYWDNLTDEQRKMRSESISGKNNPMFGKVGFWKGKKLPKQPFNKNRQKFGDKNPNWNGGSSKYFCDCGKEKSFRANSCSDCLDRSGENNPFYGKHHTDEVKNKIRVGKLGKYNGNQHRAVIIGDKEYKSVSEASRKLNVVPATIIFRIKSKHFKEYNYKN